MHSGEQLTKQDLPLAYAGTSECFRKEAGAHGKDVKGLIRTHCFTKVEQFVMCTVDQSESYHQRLLENAMEFYNQLGLPYRVIDIVSGDLNLAAIRKYDIECWLRHGQRYLEVCSISNCTDYQSRPLDVYYRDKDNKKTFVHMLNATLTAIGRTMVCIAEQYQCKEGIKIPKVLRKYMGDKELIPFL